MNRKGVIGIAVLWILAAISAVAFAALSIGRWQALRGRLMIENARAIALAQAGALLAKDAGFDFQERTFPFATGRVRVRRVDGATGDALRLRCEAVSGTLTKRVETGWRRVGGAWRADTWRELP